MTMVEVTTVECLLQSVLFSSFFSPSAAVYNQEPFEATVSFIVLCGFGELTWNWSFCIGYTCNSWLNIQYGVSTVSYADGWINAKSNTLLLRPWEGCKVGPLWWACLSSCLSAGISWKPHGRALPIFVCMLPNGRGSVLFWRHGDTLCTSGFIDDVVFTYHGAKGPESSTTLCLKEVCQVDVPVEHQTTTVFGCVY